jgi:hypothetical protein
MTGGLDEPRVKASSIISYNSPAWMKVFMDEYYLMSWIKLMKI